MDEALKIIIINLIIIIILKYSCEVENSLYNRNWRLIKKDE